MPKQIFRVVSVELDNYDGNTLEEIAEAGVITATNEGHFKTRKGAELRALEVLKAGMFARIIEGDA